MSNFLQDLLNTMNKVPAPGMAGQELADMKVQADAAKGVQETIAHHADRQQELNQQHTSAIQKALEYHRALEEKAMAEHAAKNVKVTVGEPVIAPEPKVTVGMPEIQQEPSARVSVGTPVIEPNESSIPASAVSDLLKAMNKHKEET